MNSVEFLPIVDSAISLVLKIWPFLLTLGLAAIYIWSWHRAGSAFFIQQRFFTLLGANKEFSDERINERWNNIKDFYRFNLKTGLRFVSISKRDDFLKWLDEKNIGLEEIFRVKGYISIVPPDLKYPNYISKKNLAHFYCVLILFPLILGSIYQITDYALLKVNKTGTTFWVKENKAYSWNLGSWHLNSDNCSSVVPVLNNDFDKKLICKLIGGERKDFIKDAVIDQKILGVVLFFISLFMFLFIMRWLDTARLANDMFERLKKDPYQFDMFK